MTCSSNFCFGVKSGHHMDQLLTCKHVLRHVPRSEAYTCYTCIEKCVNDSPQTAFHSWVIPKCELHMNTILKSITTDPKYFSVKIQKRISITSDTTYHRYRIIYKWYRYSTSWDRLQKSNNLLKFTSDLSMVNEMTIIHVPRWLVTLSGVTKLPADLQDLVRVWATKYMSQIMIIRLSWW